MGEVEGEWGRCSVRVIGYSSLPMILGPLANISEKDNLLLVNYKTRSLYIPE